MTEPGPAAADGAVVGIVGPDGTLVGVGVPVGARQVLTCSHVVNVALGRLARTQRPPDQHVEVRFRSCPTRPT